jgi:hypothetical protein
MAQQPQPARTDDDRVRAAPLTLILGGQERLVKPLVIRQSREWKALLAESLGELSGLSFDNWVGEGGRVAPQGVKEALALLAVQVPEKLETLVFDYLKRADAATDTEALRDLATDEEIVEALWLLLRVTFPFVWKLGDLAGLLRGNR